MTRYKKDEATSIRKGEELNLLQLQAYLKAKLPESSGKFSIEQFPGGASNLTYLIRLGKQQLVLRRPPFGSKVKSAHDMGREYKVLRALSKFYNKAPKSLLYTEDERIIGAPFYIMERVEGIILRGDGGFAKNLSEKTIYKIAESLIDTMVELHSLDYEEVGLGDLGRPKGYTERQIVGWTKRYFNAKTDEHEEVEKVAQWLNENIPAASGASIIHNDYKHDNVVLDANDLTNIIAILDWEMCTVGDPLMDFGTSLAYWSNHTDPPLLKLSFPNPSMLKGNPSRSELLAMYEQKSRRKIDQPIFYYVYGLFKLAVIVQQIYYRYHQGFTRDKRFAKMNIIAGNLGKVALRAIEKDSIDA